MSISIHALLAESDAVTTVVVGPSSDFYPRSPCGERQTRAERINRNIAFLSTLSLRRATWLELFLYYQDNNFYPRSPCGERHSARPETRRFYAISIHALLAESD